MEIEARKNAQYEHHRKAQELQSILESIPQIAFTANATGNIEYVNEQWYVYSDNKSSFPEVYNDGVPKPGFWQNTFASNPPLSIEVCIRKLNDNEYRYHLLNLIPIKEGHTIVKLVGTFTDIHEQKLARDLLEKRVEERTAELIIANKELAFQNDEKEKQAAELIIANRLYEFISQINQTIVKVHDEKTLFNEACRIAIDIGKFQLAWMSIPDKINRKLNLVAHSNANTTDLELISSFTYDDNGPTANVIRSGRLFLVNDFETESANCGSRQHASLRGFKSYIILPIMKSGQTIGTFNLFSDRVNCFNSEEIVLLKEATDDISFALDVIEKDKQRKQMEDKVIHSELRLKQAQAIAHFGSWELDFSTGIAELSEEACRIYGLAPDDNVLSYQSLVLFIPPEDLEFGMKITKVDKEKLRNSAYHHRIIRKDRTVRHIYSQAQLKFNREGKPVGLYGVAHDVTEAKEAEGERTKMIDDIVQRNKNLEQFSYIISHNLRAPVANILGITNILQTISLDKEKEKKVTGYMAIAAKNLDNVIRDINDILSLKNEMNEMKNIVILNELLSEIKLNIGNVINNEQVKIISDFSEAGDFLTIKSYLYSIFFNLISNSIKYRQPAIAPVIVITSVKLKNRIQLIFKDNGIGIDLKKNGGKVFGLYKRFHNHVEGKGMGLYMVKTQVESLGGTVTIASEVNKGTEFTLEFEINN